MAAVASVDSHLMSERTARFLVAASCLLLLLQTLPYFQSRWVEDESWYSIPGYTFLRTGELRNPTLPATESEAIADVRPPLMPLTLSFFFRILGINVIAARLGEVAAALASLLVVYAIGKSLGRPDAGAIAALALAADNFLFLAARTARPEAWVTLFCAVGLLLLIRSKAPKRAWIAFGSGLAVGIACNYHVAAIGFAAGVVLVLVYEERSAFFHSPRTYAWAGGYLAALLPFITWVGSSATRLHSFRRMYGVGEHVPLAEKLSQEFRVRLADFLGFSSQRLPLPFAGPLRLHIAVAIIVAFVIVFRRNRSVFWQITLLLIPQFLFWLYLVNKTSRYFAILGPLFSLALAFGVVRLPRQSKALRAGLAVLLVCVASEVAGNGVVLRQARTADYPALSNRLLSAVPRGKTIYGPITFAMIFNAQPYESYDRTPFLDALHGERPDFVISGDRVMMRGSGYGQDNMEPVRSAIMAYVAQQGALVAEINDSFYGDLKIWRVSGP